MSSTAGAGWLLVLLLALGGEAALGEMRWLFAHVPHPRLVIGVVVEALDRRLNRPTRGARARLVRGVLVVIAVLALAVGAGLAVAWLARHFPHFWVVEALLVMSLVAQRGPSRRVAEAAALLSQGGVIAGQEALRPVTGLPPGALDGLGLGGTVRVGVLALARSFVQGVVAPCFWYVLLGLPGLCLQQAAMVMAARLQGGPDDPRYRDFGLTAGRLNHALTLLPAVLAAVMLSAAAIFVPQTHPAAALAAAWRVRRTPAGGPAEALIAAVALEQAAEPATLDRARMIHAVACLINAGAIAALALLLLSV